MLNTSCNTANDVMLSVYYTMSCVTKVMGCVVFSKFCTFPFVFGVIQSFCIWQLSGNPQALISRLSFIVNFLSCLGKIRMNKTCMSEVTSTCYMIQICTIADSWYILLCIENPHDWKTQPTYFFIYLFVWHISNSRILLT